jgi:hypothetical protein
MMSRSSRRYIISDDGFENLYAVRFMKLGQLGGIALGYGLDDWGLKSQQGLGIFLFTTTSRLALGPTQPPIQWVSGALSLEEKWPGCEADHSPPPSAEVKNVWSYISTPTVHLHGMELS